MLYYKQKDIEELLLQEKTRRVREVARKIEDILANDRYEAYEAASNGSEYTYTAHLLEVPKGLSPFRIIQEVLNLVGIEGSYLQIKQVTAYSSRKGRLTKKRTFFAKKVPAISFSFQRRGK